MTINIPTPLRTYTAGEASVPVEASTIAAALEALVTAHPGLRANLFAADGKLRSFVNIYLNEDDIRYLPEKESTAISPTDELSIIPSIAGGRANTKTEVPAMTETVRRQQAHALLDFMNPEQLNAVAAVLEAMADPLARKHASLPIEDELISDRENVQAAAAKGPWIPIEEVMAELNITQADLDLQRMQDEAGPLY